MPSPRYRKRAVVALFAFLPLLLSACTPEKAQALLTAAKTFQAQADTALVAVQDLFIEASQRLPQTREQAIEDFIRTAEGHVRAGGAISSKDVIDRLGKVAERKAKARITKEFSELRQYYAAFAGSLTSLPQGSFFADEGVACSVDVAVRLTGSLVNYAKDLMATPVLSQRKISDLRAQFVKELKKGNPDSAKVMSLTRRLEQLIQDGHTANAEAIRLILVAAEQGRRVSRLASRYDEFSIGEILASIQQGLAFAGTIKGLDTKSMATRLGEIRTDLEGDKVWKRILALPVNTPSDNCTLKGAKT